MSELAEWSSFYVIVGSSAGALIGLQFVVIALIAETPNARPDAQAGAAFSTPSVVHFAVVLLLSAIISAPWHTIGAVGVSWGFVGISGSRTPSSWLGGCDCKRPIDLYSRIGCFTFCFHLRRMRFWPSRHTWRSPTRAQPYSSLPPRRCCSSLLAFTTRGTPLPITSCPTNGERKSE